MKVKSSRSLFVSFIVMLFSQVSCATTVNPPPRTWHPADRLPQLGIDKSSVTVSGISSGAFMAVQLGVAYSDRISGFATIAGGIYHCARGDAGRAIKVCMKDSSQINVNEYVERTKLVSETKQIADVENLKDKKAVLLQGKADSIVLPSLVEPLAEYFNKLGAKVVLKNDLMSGHNFPTPNGITECQSSEKPYIGKCDFDAAEFIFKNLDVINQSNKAQTLSSSLQKFDQVEFGAISSKMMFDGYLYVPTSCQKNTGCKLHIALHGCLQGPDEVDNAFNEKAGYNEWADNNNVVVLYPAVAPSQSNPKGCWDWFGYTGQDYHIRQSKQMTTIIRMLDRLVQNPSEKREPN